MMMISLGTLLFGWCLGSDLVQDTQEFEYSMLFHVIIGRLMYVHDMFYVQRFIHGRTPVTLVRKGLIVATPVATQAVKHCLASAYFALLLRFAVSAKE